VHASATPHWKQHSVVTGDQQVCVGKCSKLIILYWPLYQYSRAHAQWPPLYAKPSSRSVAEVATEWYPEYVMDHLWNLFNSSLFYEVPMPQISWKSTHNFVRYSAKNDSTNAVENNTSANLWRRWSNNAQNSAYIWRNRPILRHWSALQTTLPMFEDKRCSLKKVKTSHARYRACGPELIPVYRQSARRWPSVIHPAVSCHYFLPGLRLPSQPQSITALWLVPSYTAWWQRHIGVNNVPNIVMQRCLE